MAVENLIFPEAVQFNNNNLVNNHTFSQVVSYDRSTTNISPSINAATIISLVIPPYFQI